MFFFVVLTEEDALHNSHLHDAKIIRWRRAAPTKSSRKDEKLHHVIEST